MDKPVTGQMLTDVLMMLSIEIAAAVSPSTREADEALIKLANNLLHWSEKSIDPTFRQIAGTLANQLIRTEPGA